MLGLGGIHAYLLAILQIKYLGVFDSDKEAALAFDDEAEKLGFIHCLNFPQARDCQDIPEDVGGAGALFSPATANIVKGPCRLEIGCLDIRMPFLLLQHCPNSYQDHRGCPGNSFGNGGLCRGANSGWSQAKEKKQPFEG